MTADLPALSATAAWLAVNEAARRTCVLPAQRGHNAHTHGGWHVHQPSPGTFVWTSPTGRVYPRRARPLLPRAPGPDDDDGGP